MKKVIDWIEGQISSTEGYLTDRREKLEAACRTARGIEGQIAEYEKDLLGLKASKTRLEIGKEKT